MRADPFVSLDLWRLDKMHCTRWGYGPGRPLLRLLGWVIGPMCRREAARWTDVG